MVDRDPTRAPAPRVVELELLPGPLLASVIARVVVAVGARAGLDVDRLTDATMVASAIGSRLALGGGDAPVRARVRAVPGGLRIEIGPMAAGQAAQLQDGVPSRGLGAVLDRLVDRVTVTGGDTRECLLLEIDAAG